MSDKAMTKTERLLRARQVRNGLRAFIQHQSPWVREQVASHGYDPDRQALGYLVMARDDLDKLIGELLGELNAREELQAIVDAEAHKGRTS